ncbi:nucleotide exchange factor GrpE [Gordonia sp. HNM0687]|uniref:Protein GrpE n=1 Tax=Gordonia mangrovi TaxID=2665643 RepID=A0A6L7GU92_9ACTN|nr:nucleotide exchange factor GrpE [Gordonia mangrovi]MXP23574.1 nucleotide exchange factor GrpE [Gordonia mangrovi]UVF79642.1 nucleotide exchange factor GrpE [Gordonia mangrovi]
MTEHEPSHDADTTAVEPELEAVPAEQEADMPITVTDRRLIDPETGEVRPGAAGAAAAESATDAADERVAELTADLQRERAQFANFRRRAAEEKQGSVTYGKQLLIDKLLPVLDDLDRARQHGDLDEGPLRSVADKLVAALTSEGLSTFGQPGDVFDPELHEAVQHDGDGAEPVIGAVYRTGYRLGDKVIRHAMVTVTDPSDAPSDAAEQTGAQ